MASLVPSATKLNPSIASGLSIGSSGQVNGAGPSQGAQTAGLLMGAMTPSLRPTSTGGVAFNPSLASGYSSAPPAQTPTSTRPSLASYLTGSVPTPNGGTLSTLGGQPSGYNPNAGFQIPTGGAIPSNALGSNLTQSDLYQKHSTYQDYVNALSQAQGYGPDYISALQGQYGAQTQGAQLGLNQAALGVNAAALNSNFYTGNNLPGDTLNYAQGATAKALAQNTLQQSTNTLGQAQNSIQQLASNQALNTAQLARTGNIASAQTQLQYSTEGQAGSNALTQYNALQQQYPGANIPEYNQSLTPEQNQQIASYIVSNSPAYQAQFQSTFQTPGGGLGVFNKLSSSLLNQNQDGTLSLVSGLDAALGSANSAALGQQVSAYNTTNQAFNQANTVLGNTVKYMEQNGLNQTGIPIATQIANKFGKNTPQGAGVLAAYNSDIQEIRRYYSQILGGGASTVNSDKEAVTLVPDNLSPDQLAQLGSQLKQNAQSAVSSIGSQVNQITQSLQSGTVGTGLGGTGGGGLYDF